MNAHSSQPIASCECTQTWMSFINHDIKDSYDQQVKRISCCQPTDDSFRKISSHTPRSRSYTAPSTSTSSYKGSALSSSEQEIRSSNAVLATPSPLRKSRKTSSESTVIIPDRKTRRRQQNRNSQRAFRNRKEAHQRDLENQVDDLKQKHAKLFDSFTTQYKKMSHLTATVNDLNSQILSLQADMGRTISSMEPSKHGLDLFIIDQADYGCLQYLPVRF